MPTVDSENRVVGILLREDPETQNYSECFVVINFSFRLIHLYPLEAAGAVDYSEFTPIEEIKCSYITKVSITLSRPKVLNCFELVLTGVSRFFSVNTNEERDEWIEAIKQSSMSQKTYVASTPKDKPQDFGYKNQVVGGVIQKKLIKEVDSLVSEERQDLTSSGPATVGASPEETSSSPTRRKQPQILKAGYATKCGAVMKSWKRRFFILSDQSFGYYKGVDEVEPIRSVSVNEMMSVGRSKIHGSKDNLFELVTPARTFYIQADSAPDMNDWIKAFQRAIGSLRSGSSSTLPTTTKERSGSTRSNEDPSLIVQPYDASPKIIAANKTDIAAATPQDTTTTTDNNKDTNSHHNGGATVEIEV